MKAFVYLKPKAEDQGAFGCLVIDNAVRTAVDAQGSFHAENNMGSRWNIPRETIHMIEMVE